MKEKIKELPTRFHIGTQKAGSTFLYNLLDSHPKITLSSQTEVHFYNKYYEKGFDWYKELFKKEGIKIDTSPKYFMRGEVVAHKISETAGQEAKFLLILRNPVDLINSHYQMHTVSGFFTRHPEIYPIIPKNIIDCIETYPDYLTHAQYASKLNHDWLPYFDQSQIKIIIFEEFITNVDETMREITAFWDIPYQQLTAPRTSQNKLLKNQLLYSLRSWVVKRKGLKQFLKHNQLFSGIYDKWLTQHSKKTITPEERQYLAKKLRGEVRGIEKILDRKITVWSDFSN